MNKKLLEQASALRELVDAVLELKGRAFSDQIEPMQRLAATAKPLAQDFEALVRAFYAGDLEGAVDELIEAAEAVDAGHLRPVVCRKVQ